MCSLSTPRVSRNAQWVRLQFPFPYYQRFDESRCYFTDFNECRNFLAHIFQTLYVSNTRSFVAIWIQLYCYADCIEVCFFILIHYLYSCEIGNCRLECVYECEIFKAVYRIYSGLLEILASWQSQNRWNWRRERERGGRKELVNENTLIAIIQ